MSTCHISLVIIPNHRFLTPLFFDLGLLESGAYPTHTCTTLVTVYAGISATSCGCGATLALPLLGRFLPILPLHPAACHLFVERSNTMGCGSYHLTGIWFSVNSIKSIFLFSFSSFPNRFLNFPTLLLRSHMLCTIMHKLFNSLTLQRDSLFLTTPVPPLCPEVWPWCFHILLVMFPLNEKRILMACHAKSSLSAWVLLSQSFRLSTIM